MNSWIKAINDYYGDAQPGTEERNEKDLLTRLLLFWTDKLPGLPERSSQRFCVSDILTYPDVSFYESFDGKSVRVQLCMSDDAPVETERFDSLPNNLEDSSIPDSVKKKVILLRKVTNNGGVVERALLGRFVSKPTPAIHLFMGNIRAESNPLSALGATFVHEVFHAWNYFRSGEKSRTVPEIDEAMVEAATLFLINEFQMQTKQSWNWCPEILDWALDALRKKQDSFGLAAAYGYGRFLYENVVDLPSLLVRYSSQSGVLSPDNPQITEVRESLRPFYPFESEGNVLSIILESLA